MENINVQFGPLCVTRDNDTWLINPVGVEYDNCDFCVGCNPIGGVVSDIVGVCAVFDPLCVSTLLLDFFLVFDRPTSLDESTINTNYMKLLIRSMKYMNII